jgi:hypothetical protein
MTLTRASLIGFASFFSVVVGCGGGSSGSSGASGGACGAYFDALVSVRDKCGAPIASPNHVGDLRTKFLTLCQNEVSAPGASKAASAIQACADRMSAAQTCSDDMACDAPPGDLADGAACGESFQCQSGWCKTPSSSSGAQTSLCGTCAPRAPIGATCDGSSSRSCVDGAYCEVSATSSQCVAKTIGKAGDVCFDPKNHSLRVECDTGLHCPEVVGPNGDPLKCSPPAQSGEACDSRNACTIGLYCVDHKCAQGLAEGAACTGGDCGAGLGCDLTAKTCAKITYVATGQPCDKTITMCDTAACVGMTIDVGTDGVTKVTPGTCKDPIPDGAPCDEQSSASGVCAEFSLCVAGTCQQQNASLCK